MNFPVDPDCNEHRLAMDHAVLAHLLDARNQPAAVVQDENLLKTLAKEALEQLLQAEMAQFLRAEPGERTDARSGYRAELLKAGRLP